MITVRADKDRGHANHGWLDTHYTFSFSNYYDPRHMGFRALRVMNDDRIGPGGGFGAHPHNDMEILTLVMEGALEHRDSIGNGEVLRPGEVQYMSAGTGIRHSEFNPSKEEGCHLMQIWLLPNQLGLKPSYAQRPFPEAERENKLLLVASPKASNGAIPIHSDAELYVSKLAAGKTLEHSLAAGRHAWIQVLGGEVDVNGSQLASGDGAAVSEEKALTFTAKQNAEFLLFDLG